MTQAPERIWASPEHEDEGGYGGFWIKAKVAPSVEYVRADIAAAAYARGLEDAGLAVANAEIGYRNKFSGDWQPYAGPTIISKACAAIRALIPKPEKTP